MLADIYTLWLREVKLFFRKKSRVLAGLAFPFFWLFIYAAGFRSQVNLELHGIDYMQFILPGILGIVLLFQSIFFGASVIWDRRFGFLKEMLVAPISRASIVIGKTLGGATTVLLQAVLLLVLGILY